MTNKGFTLIEIIIVIVILGVLATLALPRLAAQVDAAEGAEAMQFLGVIKRAAINCYDSAGNFSVCNTSATLAVSVPAGAKFSYFQSAPVVTDAAITFWARSTRNTANYVLMRVNNTSVTQMGTNPSSPYVGIVNKVGSTTASAAVPGGAF